MANRPAPTDSGNGTIEAYDVCGHSTKQHWFIAFLNDVVSCLVVALVLTVIVVPLWGKITLRYVAQVMLVNLIISLGIGLTVSNLYRFVFPRLVNRMSGRVGTIVLHGAIAATAAFGGGELSLQVLQLMGFSVDQMRPDVFRIGGVLVIVLSFSSLGFERLKRHAREVELREQEARQMALRAQLEALQARTDPHFLFNTLNTVAGLIEEDPHAAERMLERLSGVFRYALQGSRTSWIRLGDELDAVRNYLEVERIRFGDRLRITFDVEPGVETCLVPPLVLQPLVENAVLHGVAPRTEGGEVRVHVSHSNPGLVLCVEDDGPGPGGSTHRGCGTALDNLGERLRLTYGERATIETGAGDRGGYRVTLRLPIEEPSA